MHRFFVPPESIEGDSVRLDGAVAHQLVNVLRARPGDQIAVLDGSGWEHTVTLEQISPREVRGRVTERVLGVGEPEGRDYTVSGGAEGRPVRVRFAEGDRARRRHVRARVL